MLVYLDACVLIYMVEGAPELAEAILRVIDREDVSLATSTLTRLECRVGPLRAHDLELLSRYDGVFSAPDLALVDVTTAILDRAAEIRASLGLKTPDAIHVATAIDVGADLLLTNDADLRRVPGLHVELIT